ncbi:hypothetical protein Q2T40_11795 [Winogradskyella maritima]|uniref:Adhesin n=1 Tax=Winogradskyella maritima TaxID=1517766 RepID=A0ABV8ALB6_9FLAO|nr:hypothetical protein [Winogradskyella maritima]
MLKRIPFKLLFAFLAPAVLLSSTSIDFAFLKATVEKTIEKSYDVSSNATLKVDNSYGNVNVITWDENRIEIDVTIKVTSSSEEKAQKKLDDIDVKFSASRDWVSVETIFNKEKRSWWNWGSNNNIKMQIDYTIKMPMTGNVNLNNDYGDITLDKLQGKAELNCDYGKITTKELMASGNSINFDYSNGCYFEYIKSGKINADYSSYTVSKTEGLVINADYTKSIIEMAENVEYNCDYGSLSISNINNLNGNGDYLSLRLGNVFKNVSIKADYGSIKIDRMASNAGNISIDTDYAGMTIGHDADYNFDFEIDLDYGGLRGDDGFEFSKKRVSSGSKYYSGFKGKSGSGNKVRINSDYGSITFKKK